MASEFLVHPITRFEPAEDPSLKSFIEALGRTGGQPRRLATALSLWNAMLDAGPRDVLLDRGCAGAAGVRAGDRVADRGRAIDMLDITGAQLTHDMLEVIGSRHFQGST